MRIAIIGSRGIPAGVGGVERVVEGLTRELLLRGHEVIVYSRNSYVDVKAKVSARRLITPGLRGKHLEAFTHTAAAVWDVPRRDVDVIHIHSPGPALWAPLAAVHRPVVFTVHAPDWRREKWSLPARLALRAGLEAGLRSARVATAVGEHLAEELRQRSGRDIMYVPNSVAAATPQSAEAILRWSLRPGQFALHVGRFVPEKRLSLLLEAWAEAKLPIPLAVAGGFEQRDYERRCRRLATDNTLFLGPQTGRTLAELYSHAAMVVQPSVLEGASLVLLEAAAYGRCVVCSDIPANREILGETGWYVPPENPTQIARDLIRCYEEESQRRALGEKARLRVEREFPPSRMADGYEQAYRRALQAGG
jgi:glycosyltransferase involved in cell wall biosynthesis